MFMKFLSFFTDILNLLVPSTCLVCSCRINADLMICANCDGKLIVNTPTFCIKCGIHTDFKYGKLCRCCKKRLFYFDKNYSPFIYKNKIIKALHQFKYNGFHSLNLFFAEQLSDFLKIYDIIEKHNIDSVCSVPLHIRKERERGFNQSALVAKKIAAEFNLPYAPKLKAKWYKRSQTSLSFLRRQKSVENIFSCKNKSGFKNTLLIDDVFTTGASLSQCAKVLKQSGVEQVIGLTITITPTGDFK